MAKHGRPFIVIVSAEDWCRDREPEQGIWDVLRACPADLNELDLARSKNLPRKAALGIALDSLRPAGERDPAFLAFEQLFGKRPVGDGTGA